MEFICKIGNRESKVTFYEDTDGLFTVPGKTFYVFDEFTASLTGTLPDNHIVIGRGESHKNYDTLKEILSSAVSCELGRDSRFVAVGGGVVCDMTAFAASIYMRGVPVILIPTTLLSMVDASIGGKTGIDFCQYKNMIGSFHPAEEIRIFPHFTETLSDHEFLNGLAEIIKHGLLTGKELYQKLVEQVEEVNTRDIGVLRDIIYESLLIKKEYIEKDPFETKGIRAHLNYGHTFGHAYETISGLGVVSHGEAVAWGIDKALAAGLEMGLTSRTYAEKVRNLLQTYSYSLEWNIDDITQYIKALRHDKKNRKGKTRFILQRDLADTLITEIPEEILYAVYDS